MRRPRHLAARAAIAAAVLATWSGPAIAQTSDTNPRIRPDVGDRHTTYRLHLTAGADLGVQGPVTTAYAVRAKLPGHPGCGQGVRVTSAHAGETVRLHLRPPRPAGWCRGLYRGTVALVRGPHCATASGRACPRFASVIVPAGTFRFRVR